MPLGSGCHMAEIVLFSERSRFQEILLTRLGTGEVSLYLDGAVQFASGWDETVYHHVLATMPALMLAGRDGEALVLGGGDGLAVRNLLECPGVEAITLVELDEAVLKLATQHPVMRRLNRDALHDPRVRVIHCDARDFVRSQPVKRYALAIVDFPDPLSPELEELIDESLYGALASHLIPGREIAAIQASGVFSEVEVETRTALTRALGLRAHTARFRGEWMADGSIVFGGRGVDPVVLAAFRSARLILEPGNPAEPRRLRYHAQT